MRSEDRTRRTAAPGALATVPLAIAASVLVLVDTRGGPALSPDSMTYVSGAHNLAQGHGFVDFSLQPITVFPAGFPFTLSVFDRLGIDVFDGARWLNALALGVLVVLTYFLTTRYVARRWLAVAASAIVAFSPAVLGVFGSAWSEPVFCVVGVALLLTLERLFRPSPPVALLVVGAGVLASIAFAYRYAGVVFLLTAVIAVAVSAWPDGTAAMIRRLLALGAAAALLPALIVAHNLARGASALGDRGSSSEHVVSVLREVRDTGARWVIPGDGGPMPVREAVLVLVVIVTVVGLVVWWRTHRSARSTRIGLGLLPVVVMVAGYLAYAAFSALATRIDALDTRLLIPTFAPAVVVLAVALDAVLATDRVRAHPWITPTVTVGLALWIGAAFVVSADDARTTSNDKGYSDRSWEQSELVAAVGRLPAHARVYSNVPDGLYAVLERAPVFTSPSTAADPLGDHSRDVKQLLARLGRDNRAGTYLVWAIPNPRAYLLTPAQLRADGLRLSVVERSGAGTIYRLSDFAG